MEIHDWRHKFLQGNNRDQFDHKRDDFDPRIYIPNHWSLLHMYDYSDHGFKTTSDHFSDNFELWSLNLKNLCARHATRVCVMLANKSVMSVTFGDVKVPWSSRLLDRLEYSFSSPLYIFDVLMQHSKCIHDLMYSLNLLMLQHYNAVFLVTKQ